MKKIIAIALSVITAAAVSGCGKKEDKPPEAEKNFTCNAVITQDGAEYSARLERIDGVGWNAVFTAPETIEGLELSIINDECTVRFKELIQTFDRSSLPDYGMIDILSAAADSCIAGKSDKTVSKNGVFVEIGSIRGESYTASLEDGVITQLELGSWLSAEFTEYK